MDKSTRQLSVLVDLKTWIDKSRFQKVQFPNGLGHSINGKAFFQTTHFKIKSLKRPLTEGVKG